MAAKKKKTVTESMPKGYVPIRAKLDGFFEREAGNTVIGILRGNFIVRGKFGEKKVYRIELTEGETQVGDGELVGPGGVVGLDESGYTRALSEVDPGTAVFVKYEGKGENKQDPHVFIVGRAE